MGRDVDRYERELEARTLALKKCQEEHGLQSCLPCPDFEACTLHDAYIEAVHASMHKGATGGFEF